MAYSLATNPLSILVVDDESSVREMLGWMLGDAGHQVVEVSNGTEALQHLQLNGLVDVVLSDINMPGMDGVELSRRLRERWPNLPVLLISGRPPPAGVRFFVPKPFRWDALSKAIATVIQSANVGPSHA